MLYDKQYMKMENDKLSQYTVVIFRFINFTSCDFFCLILSATFSALTIVFCSILATVSAFLILFSSSLSFFRLL